MMARASTIAKPRRVVRVGRVDLRFFKRVPPEHRATATGGGMVTGKGRAWVPESDGRGTRFKLSEAGARWWIRSDESRGVPKRYFAASFGKEVHTVPPATGPDDEKYVAPPFEAVISEGGIVIKSTTPAKDGTVPQRKVALDLPSAPKAVHGYLWEGSFILHINFENGSGLTSALPLRSN